MLDNASSRLILVTGPESSGTRWIASLISQHPQVDIGTDGTHADPLDDFWNYRTDVVPKGTIVTRRSLPAGRNGDAARYLDFDDFDRLPLNDLKVVVTVRHPWANARSMAHSRKSVRQNMSSAVNQLWAAYLHVFDYLRRHHIGYVLLPIESVVVDGSDAIRALFPLLGLEPYTVKVEADSRVNYKWVTAIAS